MMNANEHDLLMLCADLLSDTPESSFESVRDKVRRLRLDMGATPLAPVPEEAAGLVLAMYMILGITQRASRLTESDWCEVALIARRALGLKGGVHDLG